MENEQAPVVASVVETAPAPVAAVEVKAETVAVVDQPASTEKSLYDKYTDLFLAKVDEFRELCIKGSTNKSKALKARKLSLFLTEEFLNFRKLSVKNDKDELKDVADVKLTGNER